MEAPPVLDILQTMPVPQEHRGPPRVPLSHPVFFSSISRKLLDAVTQWLRRPPVSHTALLLCSNTWLTQLDSQLRPFFRVTKEISEREGTFWKALYPRPNGLSTWPDLRSPALSPYSLLGLRTSVRA